MISYVYGVGKCSWVMTWFNYIHVISQHVVI